MMNIKLSKSLFSLIGISFLAVTTLFGKSTPTGLQVDFMENPIGIDNATPHLSWKITSAEKNISQSAYELRFASSTTDLLEPSKLLYSKKVNSNKSVQIIYDGPSLNSMQRVYWQVRIWDNKSKASDWSAPVFWEMGILDPTLWKASFITMEKEIKNTSSLPAQYFRKDFSSKKEISSAKVYATSLGVYNLYLNGNKVSKNLFAPGFTSYHKRLQYQVYDVTNALNEKNTIAAIVGDGWYRGYLGFKGKRENYGNKTALFIQLVITYKDGSTKVIVTDNSWKVANGPIVYSDIYNGERYDARLEMKSWNIYGFDDKNWQSATVYPQTLANLVATEGVPVQKTEELNPVKIFKTPKGEMVVDFGQNLVGWIKLMVDGKKGDSVIIEHAEVLDKDGNFYTKNLRSAKATDTYILNGQGQETFEPHFTFHGFRYAKLINYPGVLSSDKITAMVIHSNMPETGYFTCSDSLINKLQQNIKWSQRDNFLDIPTDCPQRDERLGWTGDAQAFCSTAAYNYDVASFYAKWLKDLSADQASDGRVPNVIPNILGPGGSTGWGDAAVIMPWEVYQAYGDQQILVSQYPSMKKWVDFMVEQAGKDYLWNNPNDKHYGDWLAFHSDKPDYPGATTDKDLIATSFFYNSTMLLIKSATVLGKKDDVQKYMDIATKVKIAFNKEYVSPNGRLSSNTQTAYAIAISFDLLPKELFSKSAEYLAKDVEKFGHLTTGFLGTPLLCGALSKIGRDDLAFMLLNRKEYPSWLYPVTMGATTIWERWDTMKPDGSIIEGMNSFNHYAYGAIGHWLYTYVAGIGIDENNPGYKNIILNPHPGGGLTFVNASLNSVYGKIKSSWSIKEGLFIYDITIPANTTATVILPNSKATDVKTDFQFKATDFKEIEGSITTQLSSGSYHFSYPITN